MEEKGNTARVKRSTGVYHFRVEGYSGLSHRIGDSTESPEFELCGYTWQLRIFPGGSMDAHRGYLSYYLASKSLRPARASYKLCVCSQNRGGLDEVFISSGVRLFEAKGLQIDGWGRDKFMSSTTLHHENNGYCVDDVVLFKVEIMVYGDLETMSLMESVDLRLPPSLSQSFKELLTSEQGFDITIVFGNQTTERLLCHRSILAARSSVFRAMLFTSKMTEATTGLILIPDIDFVVMKELMLFIYTNECSTSGQFESMAEPLLVAATKYQVQGMIALCEEYLIRQINVDSVISLLRFSDTYSSHRIKETCFQYIAQHAEVIMQCKEFTDMEEGLRRETDQMLEMTTKRNGGCRSQFHSSSTSFLSERRYLPNTCLLM